VLLAFQVVYGALSAQYLLWPVPLAVLLGERFVLPHAAAATLALAGFYVLLAPGVLTPVETPPFSPAVAERLWMAGTAAVWLVCAVWTVDLLRRGRASA
jgi:drug/metabolite transporter (DMT)-like permease